MWSSRTGLISDAALAKYRPFEAKFPRLEEREMEDISSHLVVPYAGTDLLSETTRQFSFKWLNVVNNLLWDCTGFSPLGWLGFHYDVILSAGICVAWNSPHKLLSNSVCFLLVPFTIRMSKSTLAGKVFQMSCTVVVRGSTVALCWPRTGEHWRTSSVMNTLFPAAPSS